MPAVADSVKMPPCVSDVKALEWCFAEVDMLPLLSSDDEDAFTPCVCDLTGLLLLVACDMISGDSD